MKLRIKPLNSDIKLMYSNHSHYNPGDIGLDLFFPEDIIVPKGARGFIIDFGIQCEGKINDTFVPYYLYPRSSISKTPLRMSNSVGIIDAGYRGNIKACFDIICQKRMNDVENRKFNFEKENRYVQLCPPDIGKPMKVIIVDDISMLGKKNNRNNGGFGSTGN